MIHPRCQRCSLAAEQSIQPVGDGPPEYYCRPCVEQLFVANLTPVQPPAAEVSALMAARFVTGTGSQ